jgi:cardiolipin synthase A/B
VKFLSRTNIKRRSNRQKSSNRKFSNRTFLRLVPRKWRPLVFFVSIFASIWLAYITSKPPILPSKQQPVLFYSNQLQDNLKRLFQTVFRTAQKSLFLTFYSVTDSDLLALLQTKVKENIVVDITYDPTASLDLKKFSFFNLHPLHKNGLMHRKIVCMDDALVLFGTANLTPSSLLMHDNVVIGLHSPALARFLINPHCNPFYFSLKGQQAELWLLPNKDKRALQRIVELISTAKKTVKVAMFTFTHLAFTQALKEASARGIQVQIAIDSYCGKGAGAKTVAFLKNSGIKTFLSHPSKLLHHKWALIDDQILILGSANWTAAAFERNQDAFLVLYPLLPSHTHFFQKLWKVIEQEANLP